MTDEDNIQAEYLKALAKTFSQDDSNVLSSSIVWFQEFYIGRQSDWGKEIEYTAKTYGKHNSPSAIITMKYTVY